MRKITQVVGVMMVMLMLSPLVASAHGGDKNKDNNGKKGWSFHFGRKDKDHKNNVVKAGSVTAVSSTGFTMKADDGTVFTVTINGAKLVKPFDVVIQLSDIKVSDEARVKGTLTGVEIAAKSVVITPKDTHVAKTKGTVTAVNGSTVTIQATNHGVPSTVTVKTDSNTAVTKADGLVGTTTDVQVGQTVKVKGLWDEIVNVLNALKIRIK